MCKPAIFDRLDLHKLLAYTHFMPVICEDLDLHASFIIFDLILPERPKIL